MKLEEFPKPYELGDVIARFSHVDEFGSVTEIMDRLGGEYHDGEFEYLVEVFKRFMLAKGYHSDTVNKIQIVED